jgi:hypothetical protein
MPFPVKLRSRDQLQNFATQTLPAASDAKFHLGAVPLSPAPAFM